jgi:hypothetical protein
MPALPRRTGVLLAGGCAVLLGGAIGLTWWWLRLRRGPPAQPRSLLRRIQLAVVVVLVVLLGVGLVWRSKVAFANVAACQGPSGGQPSSSSRPAGPELAAEKVITWPETGLGMLYGNAVGSAQCFYGPTGYYVDFHSGRYAGARIVNVGDITLCPPFDTRVLSGQAEADHEARHRAQWAVMTVIAGPAAFPILYGIDDFFFPGARNQFERLAGLDSGGYAHIGVGPVIGWPQLVVLILVAVLIAVLVGRRIRSHYVLARRNASQDEEDRDRSGHQLRDVGERELEPEHADADQQHDP